MYLACYALDSVHPSYPDWLLVELNAAAVMGLALVDSVILEYYHVPSLYRFAPRYVVEPVERWKDIATVLKDKTGDCKDFTAWRLAELWRSGIGARAESIVQRSGRDMMFHTYVRYDDGKVEDPARLLGMP
jgi:transglutaminase-like putative cysteine protease